ncbi:MAG: KR domain-containing protein [Rhodospirillaceae bacterium]|nr:KR domain-containing protein [Rhodospirillales bacterium]
MTDGATSLRKAVSVIAAQRKRLDALERGLSGPIAVIGLGCRFPGGAHSPALLWELFRSAGTPLRDLPPERLPDMGTDGHITTTRGCFLDDIDRFDAEFFGIAPREARLMDPQQRVLMEVVHEALEDACLPSAALAGARGGVFMGVMAVDYATLAQRTELMDTHTGTGTSSSLLAGRISHRFDLRGPAVTINTACSSSLVAVHQAMVALRRGECDLALAGGVNLMLTPEVWLIESHTGMLAPDGRCKPFDEQADGFGRGEGCGVVVLKRLDDALAAGDAIQAVLLGSAVNHDGRSAGLMVPSPRAQIEVIRAALADAGAAPAEIGYVEAHGTGTRLGDPIEAEALAAAYGEGRNSPLVVGAAKANLGHTEGAAGILGLIRLVLSLKHRMLTPLPLPGGASSRIDWGALGLRPATEEAFPGGERLIGGVSSFGFSGTNAHVLAASPPQVAPPIAAPEPLFLSAPDEPRLRLLAGRFADYLRQPGTPNCALIAAACRSGRERYGACITIPAGTPGAMAAALDIFASQGLRPEGATGGVTGASARMAIAGMPTLPWAASRHWVPRATTPTPMMSTETRATETRGAIYGHELVAVEPLATMPTGQIVVVHDGSAAAVVDAFRLAGVQVSEFSPSDIVSLPAQGMAVLAATGPAAKAIGQARNLADAILAQGAGCRLSLLCQHGAPDAGAVLGFLRSLFVEHPALAGRLIEAEAGVSGERITAALTQSRETRLVVAAESTLAPRLVALDAAAGPSFRARSDRSYLVTGGFGTLGQALAGWLVERGARHLLLAGRNPPQTNARMDAILNNPTDTQMWARMLDWRAKGVSVTFLTLDVAETDAVAQAVGSANPQLGGVIHAAGISNQGRSTEDVMRPKVAGASALDVACQGLDLDLFLLCSSASVWGGAHLADYAAANAFMDQLAVARAARGETALSVQFGGWEGSAMLADASLARYQESKGFRALPPARMLRLLDALVAARIPLGAAVDVDLVRYRAVLEPSGQQSFLDRIAPAPVPAATAGRVRDTVLRAHPGRRAALILREAANIAARLLGYDANQAPAAETPLLELGFNSLIAVEFRDALSEIFSLDLPSTLIYQTPTLRAVADHLAGLLAEADPVEEMRLRLANRLVAR